jgi:uncharacterized membrane protein
MPVIARFIRTTLLGGIFILLPVLMLCMVLREALQLALALAAPLVAMVPIAGASDYPIIFAALVLVVASFAIGLIARSRMAKRVGRWSEARTVGRLPVYRVMRELSAGILGSSKAHAFTPALFEHGDESEPAYLIEDPGGDRVTIMLPWAPTPLAGSIRIVPRARVKLVSASLADFTMFLSHWGVGAQRILGLRDTPRP